MQTICMKWQSLFYGENKKNVNLSSAEWAHNVVKVSRANDPDSERFSMGKQYVICLSETCNGLWSLSYQVQKHGDNNESCRV